MGAGTSWLGGVRAATLTGLSGGGHGSVPYPLQPLFGVDLSNVGVAGGTWLQNIDSKDLSCKISEMRGLRNLGGVLPSGQLDRRSAVPSYFAGYLNFNELRVIIMS